MKKKAKSVLQKYVPDSNSVEKESTFIIASEFSLLLTKKSQSVDLFSIIKK